MRMIAILLISVPLAGCVTLPKGMLANRISTTLGQDECRVDSRWGLFGVSTPIDERDCQAIIEAQRLRLLIDAAGPAARPAAPASAAQGA